MAWDDEIDVEGSVDLNPPKDVYLIEITEGSSYKNEDGALVPRTRGQDNCPTIMYKGKIVMNVKGSDLFEAHSFNFFVSKDERGQRMLRRMIRAFLPDQKGKVKVSDDMFNGLMAWVEAATRGDWFNINHDTWAPKNSHKVSESAASTSPKPGAAKSEPEDDDMPF